MAEKKEKKRASREIKDAGQRLVFAGVALDANMIAGALSEAMAMPDDVDDAEAKQALTQKALGLLNAEDGGVVTVWVQVGAPVDGSPAKQAAIDKIVGEQTPGRFRSPTSTSWRGEVRRRPPRQVSLEVEVLD